MNQIGVLNTVRGAPTAARRGKVRVRLDALGIRKLRVRMRGSGKVLTARKVLRRITMR